MYKISIILNVFILLHCSSVYNKKMDNQQNYKTLRLSLKNDENHRIKKIIDSKPDFSFEEWANLIKISVDKKSYITQSYLASHFKKFTKFECINKDKQMKLELFIENCLIKSNNKISWKNISKIIISYAFLHKDPKKYKQKYQEISDDINHITFHLLKNNNFAIIFDLKIYPFIGSKYQKYIDFYEDLIFKKLKQKKIRNHFYEISYHGFCFIDHTFCFWKKNKYPWVCFRFEKDLTESLKTTLIRTGRISGYLLMTNLLNLSNSFSNIVYANKNLFIYYIFSEVLIYFISKFFNFEKYILIDIIIKIYLIFQLLNQIIY